MWVFSVAFVLKLMQSNTLTGHFIRYTSSIACKHNLAMSQMLNPLGRSMWLSQLTEFQTEHQNEEKDIVVGTRQVGLSLSENADLLGFSLLSHLFRAYREWYPESSSCVNEKHLLM